MSAGGGGARSGVSGVGRLPCLGKRGKEVPKLELK